MHRLASLQSSRPIFLALDSQALLHLRRFGQSLNGHLQFCSASAASKISFRGLNQPFGIEIGLTVEPGLAPPYDVRAIPLRGVGGLISCNIGTSADFRPSAPRRSTGTVCPKRPDLQTN